MNGEPVTEQEILAHRRTLIAAYKCPKRSEFVTELPRLTSGKVSKVLLRQMEAERG